MLSVLIPIYNQDVTALVSDIHKQLTKHASDFEILCFDDASTASWRLKNNSISHIDHVIYREMPTNLGRSKIRNRLARDATYETLLFLDSDSKIISDKFIKTYLDHLDGKKVINGGRCYPTTKPSHHQQTLHYIYGVKKEAKSAEQRRQKPALYFHTNNFVVQKKIVTSFPFAESLTEHGYEDLAFATTLQRNGIPINHIDNPVEHEDLVSAQEFLRKMKESSASLAHLYANQKIMSTPLIKAFETLKRTKTISLFNRIYELRKAAIIKNLNSSQPSLGNLDMFKLYHFCQSINKSYE